MIVVDGLEAGREYSVTVAATNRAGTGPNSAPSQPFTPTVPGTASACLMMLRSRRGRCSDPCLAPAAADPYSKDQSATVYLVMGSEAGDAGELNGDAAKRLQFDSQLILEIAAAIGISETRITVGAVTGTSTYSTLARRGFLVLLTHLCCFCAAIGHAAAAGPDGTGLFVEVVILPPANAEDASAKLVAVQVRI